MKKLQLVLLLCTALLLAACGADLEPREVNSETDVCIMCNMSVTHVDYAAQIVKNNGDHLIFDDLGCLMEYVNEYGEAEIGASYIMETDSPNWLNVKEAVYVYNKDYWTPMNYGVLAFATKEDAEAYMAKEQQGELLAYDDLLTFNWGVHAHE